MGLIKAENVPTQRIAPFSMADIEKQARAILTGAKMRAERLLAEAQQEAEELKRRAYATALEEGKRKGIAEGLKEGERQGRETALTERRQEMAQLAGALAQAAVELDASRIELHSQAKTAVVELAIAIADRVTKRQGALDPRVLAANVEEALKLVVGATDVRIAVHPDQQATLQEVLPAIQVKWPKLSHVELIADAALGPGGCRVFTGGGQIDADLDIQLNRIAAELVASPEGGQ